MKKMEYKTRKWHDKCFQCVVCKTQVGSKPFIIPNETDVYCVGCFEEKFATKCTKCKKIMTTGGVTFKNEVQKISLLFRIKRFILSFPLKSIIFSRHGTESVLFVQIVKLFWLGRNSHLDKTSPIGKYLPTYLFTNSEWLHYNN